MCRPHRSHSPALGTPTQCPKQCPAALSDLIRGLDCRPERVLAGNRRLVREPVAVLPATRSPANSTLALAPEVLARIQPAPAPQRSRRALSRRAASGLSHHFVE